MILQTRLSLSLETPEPATSAGAAQAYGLRRTSEAPALCEHSLDEKVSGTGTSTRVSMQLHSGVLPPWVALNTPHDPGRLPGGPICQAFTPSGAASARPRCASGSARAAPTTTARSCCPR